MYKINEEDLSIYATRGDIVLMDVAASFNGKPYTFIPGDLVRIKVYKKKKVTDVVLVKDFPVTTATQKVQIYLSGNETKFDEPINKPTTYWYEVVLNEDTEPQTIIGYDSEEGAKLFILLPEGATEDDAEDYDPSEDERYMDYAALVRQMAQLEYSQEQTHKAVAELYVTPQMYGAIGDGESDDTEALQKAIDNAEETIALGDKTYFVSDVLELKSNLTIDGCGAKIIRASSADKIGNIFWGKNVKNVTIKGIEFVSAHDKASVNTSINGTGMASNIDALHFKYIDNLRVVDCKFRGLTSGVKVDENLDDVTSVINHGVQIDGCLFDDTVFMPIYIGGLSGCSIMNCDISAKDDSTKLCHHVYISSACKEVYIYGNSFKGGTGQVINCGSAYTGATAPKDIHIFNNKFADFKYLLSVVGGEVFFENNVCHSAKATNGIYIQSLGTLKIKNCDITINAKLFDTEGFVVELVGCSIKCNGIVFTAGNGSSLTAIGCCFTVINGTSVVDITSAVSVKVVFKDCVFNTSITGTNCAFMSRMAGCTLVVDGCSFYNATATSFASDGKQGKAYVINSAFVGFSKLFYAETGTEKLLNNQVVASVL